MVSKSSSFLVQMIIHSWNLRVSIYDDQNSPLIWAWVKPTMSQMGRFEDHFWAPGSVNCQGMVSGQGSVDQWGLLIFWWSWGHRNEGNVTVGAGCPIFRRKAGCPEVKTGETWWNMVKHGETWWNMVKHGETWWNQNDGTQKSFPRKDASNDGKKGF